MQVALCLPSYVKCTDFVRAIFFQLQRSFWILSGILEYVPDSCNWQKSDCLISAIFLYLFRNLILSNNIYLVNNLSVTFNKMQKLNIHSQKMSNFHPVDHTFKIGHKAFNTLHSGSHTFKEKCNKFLKFLVLPAIWMHEL